MHLDNDATCTIENIFTPLQAGDRLANRFVIRRLLGRGGYGSVYLALDEKLDIEIALKLLHRETGSSLRHEVLLARKISHPHVVRLHDLYDSEYGCFYTMDFISGESLASRLDRDKRLPPDQIFTLATSLLGALKEAHKNGVIHLDLKPDNILLGQNGQAFITDFGVARALGEDTIAPSGTPDYLSPEQIQGKVLDGRSDLFSLGVILYEVATGQLPFGGNTSQARMKARLSTRPQPPHHLNREIPLTLSRFILDLLSKRPGQRPASAELAQSLLSRSRVPARWQWLIPLLLIAVAPLIYWQSDFSSPTVEQTRLPTLLILPADTSPPIPNWLALAAAEQLHSQLSASPRLHLVDQHQVFNYIAQVRWDFPLSRAQQEELLQAFGAVWIVAPKIQPLGDKWNLTVSYGPPSQNNAHSIDQVSSPESTISTLTQLGTLLLAQLDGEAPQSDTVPSEVLGEVTQIRQLLDNQEYTDALDRLSNLTQVWPSPLSWYLSFSAYNGLNQQESADKAIKIAASLIQDPNTTLALRIQFEQQRLNGQSDKALETLALLSQRQPFDARLAHLNAELLADHKDLQTSAKYLETWLETSPTDARGWYLLGRQQIRIGNAKQAAENPLARALILARSQHQEALEADVLAAIGVAQERLGNLDHAKDYYQEALVKRNLLDDKVGQAGILANLSYLSVVAGDSAGASKQLDDALAILATEHAPELQASLHNDKGLLLEEAGEYGAAKQEYLKALSLRRELAAPGLVAESQANVGYIAMLSGDSESARVFFQQSLLGHEKLGDRRGMLYVRQYLATLESREGHWPEATQTWLLSREEADAIDDQHAQLSALIHLAQLSLWRGQYDKAVEELDQATMLATELQDSRADQEILLLRAEMLLRYGGDPSELQLGEQATPDQRARHQLIKAEWRMERGDLEQSRLLVSPLLTEALPAWEASWRQYLANQLGMDINRVAPTSQVWRWRQGLDRESLPDESWFAIRLRAKECSIESCRRLPVWFTRAVNKEQMEKFLAQPWIPQAWRMKRG
ncbi:serine/threonine-protein kinase [Microbulbifer pacificus]|uniref:serine/threonine-protein kinase n=1 Tax=Microbulbifer pacificus TaxID=407164 RepID=UPI001319CFAC|nr:serine/threonine-protein kinase [Microbulbifer pacificus]